MSVSSPSPYVVSPPEPSGREEMQGEQHFGPRTYRHATITGCSEYSDAEVIDFGYSFLSEHPARCYGHQLVRHGDTASFKANID